MVDPCDGRMSVSAHVLVCPIFFVTQQCTKRCVWSHLFARLCNASLLGWPQDRWLALPMSVKRPTKLIHYSMRATAVCTDSTKLSEMLQATGTRSPHIMKRESPDPCTTCWSMSLLHVGRLQPSQGAPLHAHVQRPSPASNPRIAGEPLTHISPSGVSAR